MALIKCPECGKEVSDKASACIHCGYPLEKFAITKETIVKVDNITYNIAALKKKYNKYSDVDKTFINKKFRIYYKSIKKDDSSIISTKYNSSVGDNLVQMVGQMFNWWKKNGKMHLTYKFLIECINHNFEYFEFNTADYASAAPKPAPAPAPNPNVVRCPKCGSTSITTQERGFDIMWGFLGASKKKNLCQKCGYKWWPGSK